MNLKKKKRKRKGSELYFQGYRARDLGLSEDEGKLVGFLALLW